MNNFLPIKSAFIKLFFLLYAQSLFAQSTNRLTNDLAYQLSKMPLNCLSQEFPNKTAHVLNTAIDGKLLPHELHPSFYGCFDWHSSVHGHWLLIKLLKRFPHLPNRDSIIEQLNKSFDPKNIIEEANYFEKYEVANIFERTYGWAWILKLDIELATWHNDSILKWHPQFKPLCSQIVNLWKAYLPKQTYPNRTGVHSNTAFGLLFALEWARINKDSIFEKMIVEKALEFYGTNRAIPAYLEPDGSDFFSPSLLIADLMSKIYPPKKFVDWINHFYTNEGIIKISNLPKIIDLNDYQAVHLVGLSFSRAWNMKNIAHSLPKKHKLKVKMEKSANEFIKNGLELTFKSNYGGSHWLGTFALLALDDEMKN